MRYVMGCMTGTSMDGIDVALVALTGHALEMRAEIINTASAAFDAQLARDLKRFAAQEPLSASAICDLNQRFSTIHTEIIQTCRGTHQLDLIAVHGQTVFHQAPLSWQLINPQLISQACQVDVVSDLRGTDLARGGQGAPITPLADFILFRDNSEQRAICNLGGFCNITLLPTTADTAAIEAFDCCSCNHLLNTIAQQAWQTDFDDGGKQALSGTCHEAAAADLLQRLQQQHQHRSLGTGDEVLHWIDVWLPHIPATDLAHSACWALASCIAARCADSERIICAGGGVHNACLMHHLSTQATISTSDHLGVPAAYREAVAMAILGACAQDRQAITLPQVTHASASSSAGQWTYYS